MESINATLKGYTENRAFEVDPRVEFEVPVIEQTEFGQGKNRVEYLGDVENPQLWEQGQGNFEGEFLGDLDAAQSWGAEAGELNVGFGGAQDDNNNNNSNNNGQMLALGGFAGYGMPMAAPVQEFAAELPAVHNGWEVAAPTGVSWDSPHLLSLMGGGAPGSLVTALPPGQPMYPVAPPMAAMGSTSYPMAPPMGFPVAPPMGFPVAPPMTPTGYMITTVVAPLAPATNPISPPLNFPTMGRVYQIAEDGYSGLGVPMGI